jgi:23S rRNA pseudouridine1911/1915/1917 synthase
VAEQFPITISLAPEHAGRRLDQLLTSQIEGVSRARVQQLISEQKVLVNDVPAKASLKVRGDEFVTILGDPQRAPLKAAAEQIPLDIVYEDADLAVINKPAGMTVHAGAGATDDARNRGTLVNALLFHLQNLSGVGGELRPGIVHRLDKETSGLIMIAKNDAAHRKLAAQFAAREVKKKYVALVHGWLKNEYGTIDQSISRDRNRRTRMTTRVAGGRTAVTHYRVRRRLDTKFGKFTLLDVKIDTGRTHQIRVHMASLGHTVVGDATYGAPRELKPSSKFSSLRKDTEKTDQKMREQSGEKAPKINLSAPAKPLQPLSLPRNFLHSAELEFLHPRTGRTVSLKAKLPPELEAFLQNVERE